MRRNNFIISFFLILFLIIASGYFSIDYLFKTVPVEEGKMVYYQDIQVKDGYNSSFHLDVRFTTEKPYFLVDEKINITVSLKRIHNNSVFPLSGVNFALINSESQLMPHQRTHIHGVDVPRDREDYYLLHYNTSLSVSSKYSCRLIFEYANLTNINLSRFPYIDYETIVKGPLIEVQPISTELQTEWAKLQVESSNKTIALAILVILLSLLTILINLVKENSENYEFLKRKIFNFIGLEVKEMSFFDSESWKNVDFEKWRNRFFVISIILIPITLIILFFGISYDNGKLIYLFEFLLPVGIAFFSLTFSAHSICISRKANETSEKSDEKMKSISNAEIYDIPIQMEWVRRRYQEELRKYSNKKFEVEKENEEIVQHVTEWATWMNFQYIKKGTFFKDYISDESLDGENVKNRLIRYHKILADHIINEKRIEILTVRHISHLLMGCKKLKEAFKDLGKYEKGLDEENSFETIFSRINLVRVNEDESFLEYLNRYIEYTKSIKEGYKQKHEEENPKNIPFKIPNR